MNTLNWSKKEFHDLKTPGLSFEDVAEISKKNILRIRDEHGSIDGISTPYTTGGYGMKLNTTLFYKCMNFLEDKEGIKIFNFPVLDIAIKPLREAWCIKNNTNYCDLIFEIVYREIFENGNFKKINRTSIWWSSDGCGREDGMFKEFNIPISPFPDSVFRNFLKELNLPELKQIKAVSL